jgi:hypothetical protein
VKRLLALLLFLCGNAAATDFLAPGYFASVVSGGSLVTTDKFTAVGSHSTLTTPPYSFRDATSMELWGVGTARGAASFSDARVTWGVGGSDHIHSFQALTNQINTSGTVLAYRGFAAGPVIEGVVTNAEMFSAINPSGSGPIETLVGLRVAPLNRGTTNLAILTEGNTPSQFGGQIRTKSGVAITAEGSDDIVQGPFLQFSNVAGDRIWVIQMNANSELDFWQYNGSAWALVMTIKR